MSADDLAWWHELAPTLEWAYATTMPGVPHAYVVAGKTPGFTEEDAKRAARTVQAWGRPATFNGKPKIYLDGPAPAREKIARMPHEGEWPSTARYWVEFAEWRGETVDDCRLVNVAVAPDVWDDGTAPVTDTAEFTKYDELAAGYDEMYTDPEDVQENKTVQQMLFKLLGAMHHAPITLDVGAGTGLLLDLTITSPLVYTGVDPSRGMLNKLFRKHPNVARVVPARADEALPAFQETGETFELVTALFGAASYIEPGDVDSAIDLVRPGGVGVFMPYAPGYAPGYYAGEEREAVLSRAAAVRERLTERLGPSRFHIGTFDVWVVGK